MKSVIRMFLFYVVLVLFTLFQTSVKGNIMAVTLYAIHFEATPFTIGVIVSLYSLFPIVLAIYAGKISDRLGFKIPIILGSFGMSIALFLPFYFPFLATLYVSQTLAGISQVFLHVTVQSLVGEISNPANRSRNFSTFSLTGSIATLLGPLITGFFIELTGYAYTYLLLSIFALTAGISFVFTSLPSVKNKLYKDIDLEKNSKRQTKLLKNKPLVKIVITSGIILTGIGLYNFYFPIFGSEIGLSESVIGMIISVHALAYILIRIVIPYLITKYKAENILVICLLISALGFSLIPLFGNTYLLGCVSFLLGLGLGAGHPLSIIMTYERTPEHRKGEALGMRLTANKIAQFLVPLVFGAAGTIIGYTPIFWAAAFILLIGIIFNTNLHKK